MTEFVTFGEPATFAISLRWTPDAQRIERRPAGFGWSMGDLILSIGGKEITASRRGGTNQRHVGWYLLPLFEWLLENWGSLFHEEDFAWPEKSSAPAIVACHRALSRWAGEVDDLAVEHYDRTRRWYSRHAIRSAARGGLFPDVFIRRFQDDVELSWASTPPVFAPEGFSFVSEPGVARIPVGDVAGPLWMALDWAARTANGTEGVSAHAVDMFGAALAKVGALPSETFASIYVGTELFSKVELRLRNRRRLDLLAANDNGTVPVIQQLPPAVAMFGGLSPNLNSDDVGILVDFLVDASGAGDTPSLAKLVASRELTPLMVPHEQGYRLAEELLDDLDQNGQPFIDIRAIVANLGIGVREVALASDSIRGVAMAGEGFSPTVIVNTNSTFNSSENGKRFTIAHEFCHVLFDRTRARRVTQASGPWAPPGIEKRANAFAAYLLMPRTILLRHFGWGEVTRQSIVAAAQTLRVSSASLLEHLYNLDFISDGNRESLRHEFVNH